MTDRSSALLTDRYELTMLDTARHAGIADVPVTFEVFSRRVPPDRPAGVFAGLGRLLEQLERFRFGAEEIAWLDHAGVVSTDTLEWLRSFRFSGAIDAYPEGEWYTAGSPVLTVSGSFGESVLLETLVLSILNFDSAVASAASVLAAAAGGRPIIEMGSRRTDPDAAVGAARAAYLGGFASTSNLEAGRRYGIPTAGTVAHAFILAFPSEEEAFAAQVVCTGPDTTLLVDTFDIAAGIRHAVAAAGPALGGIRIDSGDLPAEAHRARALLDELGATSTRIVVTGDLDLPMLRVLRDAPVDAYGVGTNVVTGLGWPTAGFVYKLAAAGHHAVAKLSVGKETIGGRKQAWRIGAGTPSVHDLVGPEDAPRPEGGRRLLRRFVAGGVVTEAAHLDEARAWHAVARRELVGGATLALRRF